MRNLKFLLVSLLLAFPLSSMADARDVPGAASWYFYVDLEQMRSGGPGKAVYDWLREEVMDEVKDDSGLDIEREVDRLIAWSMEDNKGVMVVEGNFSQNTRDIAMAFIASGGDINPLKSSGKTYFRFAGNDDIDDDVSYDAGNIKFQIDDLKKESWISTDVKNKIIVTATEGQMQELLASNGKIPGRGGQKGALLVLSAEKTLVQAGMRASALGEDTWDSNVLRNTEQAALLIAAAADKLSIEAKLTTIEAEMAESMASVVRGLISLAAFDDDMDAETMAVLRGTRVDAKDNSLTISMAINPGIVVSTLRN